jgi:Putative prokaryotic signal transducing protein
MTTPEQERFRLAEVYSGKSDGELEELAATGFELSEEAHQALESEITRRGLSVAIAPPPGFDVPELNDTVLLRQFRDLPEALLAKGSLESAGIQAYLVDDNMIRMDWFISNLLGGIKLKVRAEDAAAANEILNQPIPEIVDVEAFGEYEQPKCPRCQSLDVSFQELNKFLSYGSAYVSIPVPIQKKAWTCHACGNEWEEEETALPASDGDTSSKRNSD